MPDILDKNWKISLVSSGLEHIHRGVETWVRDLGFGLDKEGIDYILFKGSGIPSDREKVIPCIRRGIFLNRLILKIATHLGGWRYGFGSSYYIEQSTFAPGLIKKLRKERPDIVHLQDPRLAWLLEKAYRQGKHFSKVIFAHGTGEDMEFRQRFQCLQELSPYYLNQVLDSRQNETGKMLFAIPNFVDTDTFKPIKNCENITGTRRKYGIPADAFVVGSVGAVRKGHKRMDYLIKEFGQFLTNFKSSKIKVEKEPFLLIVGATEDQSRDVIDLAKSNIPEVQFQILLDIPADKMPELYHAMDVFALCSLEEIFGICFLEAMASGVPCIGHKYPVTEWIIGDALASPVNDYSLLVNSENFNNQEPVTDNCAGGVCIDMSKEGELAKTLETVIGDQFPVTGNWLSVAGDGLGWIENHGKQARERVEKMFSWKAVYPRIAKMYSRVVNDSAS